MARMLERYGASFFQQVLGLMLSIVAVSAIEPSFMRALTCIPLDAIWRDRVGLAVLMWLIWDLRKAFGLGLEALMRPPERGLSAVVKKTLS